MKNRTKLEAAERRRDDAVARLIGLAIATGSAALWLAHAIAEILGR